MEKYININEVAKIKGLNSNRSIRLAIQKGKYIAREVEVRGGKSYEILYSSLEAEVQEKLEDEEIRGTSLVPILNQEPTFISEKAKMTALARVDILHALLNIRGKYSTKKEADSVLLQPSVFIKTVFAFFIQPFFTFFRCSWSAINFINQTFFNCKLYWCFMMSPF